MSDEPSNIGKRRLIVLGSGTSVGVPMIGCECGVCTSADPRNKRTRPSVLFELPGANLLIDTTPEMRIQLLRERIKRVDAILYTHAHADHLFGLDDARMFSKGTGNPVPVYCEQSVEDAIRKAFSYAFSDWARRISPGGVPHLAFHRIEPGKPIQIADQTLVPIRLLHGKAPVLGFRLGNTAYCTDVSSIPDESSPLLEGLDVLILDALRYDPHPTHFSLAQALEVVESLRPRQTYLTHLSHAFDHAAAEASLPRGVALAYDGLAFTI